MHRIHDLYVVTQRNFAESTTDRLKPRPEIFPAMTGNHNQLLFRVQKPQMIIDNRAGPIVFTCLSNNIHESIDHCIARDPNRIPRDVLGEQVSTRTLGRGKVMSG